MAGSGHQTTAREAWALTRGTTDGTQLGDLRTRRVVYLLPDRRAETLAASGCAHVTAGSGSSRVTAPPSSRAA